MSTRFIPLLLAAVCLVGLAGCQQMIDSYLEDKKVEAAKQRVEGVLAGAKKGGMSNELQLAIAQWYRGRNRLDTLEEYDVGSDKFDKWLTKKGLFRKVKTWEVLDAEALPREGIKPFAVLVTVKINKKTYKMKVPEDNQISWAK